MSAATGTDWTRILSDPDLVRHVGKLLQAYREAPAEKREEALLAAMREIKAGALDGWEICCHGGPDASASSHRHRQRHRLLLNPICSARIGEATGGGTRESSASSRSNCALMTFPAPIWGNLSNTSVGGCLVETAQPGQAGVESGNRPLGAQRKNLGQRVRC